VFAAITTCRVIVVLSIGVFGPKTRGCRLDDSAR